MVNIGEPVVLKAFSVPDAYFELNRAIWTQGIEWLREEPHNEMTKALLNVSLHISHPEIRPLRHSEAPITEEYITAYTYTKILSGEKEKDESYTYGERLRKIDFMGTTIQYDQFERALEKLKQSQRTRRCVLVIARPWDIENPEPPCMREIHLWLQPPNFDKTHLSVFFRSWDAYKAANANLGALQLLQEEAAQSLKVQTGTITVFASNAHIYQRDFQFVQQWLEKKDTSQRWWKEVKEE